MSRIEYKGYIIHATPYQLTEDKCWTINIHIKRHTGSGVNDKNFSAANTFPTKNRIAKLSIVSVFFILSSIRRYFNNLGQIS